MRSIEVFTEVVVAPDFDEEALEIFKRRKICEFCAFAKTKVKNLEYKQISGGFLVQDQRYLSAYRNADLKFVTERKPPTKKFAHCFSHGKSASTLNQTRSFSPMNIKPSASARDK